MSITRINQTTEAVIRPVAAAAPKGGIALVASGLCVVTMLARLLLHSGAFDFFGDEVIYTDLGRSVVYGGFPRFFGEPFFLHGPAFFYLEAGWSWIAGRPAGLVAWIYEMRELNALLAGATVVVLILLTARISSVRAAAVTGALFALDPFCIRQNDRVLLETAMMLWVLLGYLVFISLTGRPASHGTRARAFGAGLLFGCAVLTKDEAVLLTVLPLLGVAILRLGPRRSMILLTISATALPYAVYVAVVAANGYFAGWWSAKTSGIQRLLGTIQTTGFHSTRGGSLSSRLLSESGNFVTTYVLLAVAVPTAIIVLRRGSRLQRILALLYCAAAITLGYAVALGTLEEQELYLLVVPGLVMIPAAVTLLHVPRHARRSLTEKHRRIIGNAIIATTITLALGLNLATCVQWLRQPDEGFAHLLPYMAAHVPAGTAVDIAAGTPPPNQTDGGRYALEGRYDVGLWTTPSALQKAHVRYILVEWGPIEEGYSYLNPSQVRGLVGHTRLVFSFRGRTYGQLALYQLTS